MLVTIYNTFPSEHDFIIIQNKQEYEQAEIQDEALIHATVRFFENEGVLIYAESIHGGYLGMCLTAKGLVAMNAAADMQYYTIAEALPQALLAKDGQQLDILMRKLLLVFVGL
ncbi:MAG: hypothetical protein R8K21_05765 [Mariprofundales bacterium]